MAKETATCHVRHRIINRLFTKHCVRLLSLWTEYYISTTCSSTWLSSTHGIHSIFQQIYIHIYVKRSRYMFLVFVSVMFVQHGSDALIDAPDGFSDSVKGWKENRYSITSLCTTGIVNRQTVTIPPVIMNYRCCLLNASIRAVREKILSRSKCTLDKQYRYQWYRFRVALDNRFHSGLCKNALVSKSLSDYCSFIRDTELGG